MKSILRSSLAILCLLGFLSNNATAQLEILNLEMLSTLKNTTTIVFMPAADTSKHQIYRELMEEHWDITPLQFISYDQYVHYKNKPGYSYLLFGDDHSHEGTAIFSYVYFELWVWNGSGDHKKKSLIGRLELYPDPQTTFDPSLIYDYRYNTEGHIFNWTPGMFKNYVQLFQRHLSNQTARSLTKPEEQPAALNKLKDKVLYIPEYALQQYNGNQVLTGTLSASEMMADYPYKYKVVTNAELSKMLLESKEPIYYLLFVRSNSDKYVSVIEGHEGHIVYSRFSSLSFSLKRQDLKKLAKTMQGI